MSNLAITYQHIADILSFKSPNYKLEKVLSNPSFNWDSIVIEGSKHLVLPAIYCRLQSKNLLHLLPKDLNIYLEEITTINRNRNEAILLQVHSIAKLLTKHQIEHVFLKGAALLARDCFKDKAERMIGDIDVLVKKTHLKEAFELLKKNGYDKTKGFAYKTINYRHLDRLISDRELAAIELHEELLNLPYRHLMDTSNILKSKTYKNNVAMPSIYYLNMHQILGWQTNNLGYFYRTISFKSFYDSIVLSAHTNRVLITDLLKNKYGQGYLVLAKFYLLEFDHIVDNKQMISHRNSHQNFINNFVFQFFLKPLKFCYIYVEKRLKLLFNNKFYRLHLLKLIFICKK